MNEEQVLALTEVHIQEVTPEQWNALATELRQRMRGIYETRGGIETVSLVQEDAALEHADRTVGN